MNSSLTQQDRQEWHAVLAPLVWFVPILSVAFVLFLIAYVIIELRDIALIPLLILAMPFLLLAKGIRVLRRRSALLRASHSGVKILKT